MGLTVKLSNGRLFIRNISTITRALHDLYDVEYKPYNLIKSRDAVLRRVIEKPGCTQEELCNNLKMDRSTMSRILKMLEKDGYIKRVIPVDNTRIKEVYPTQEGIEAYEIITSVLNDAIEKCILSQFSDEELERLVEDVEKIRKSVDIYWFNKKQNYLNSLNNKSPNQPKKYIDTLFD